MPGPSSPQAFWTTAAGFNGLAVNVAPTPTPTSPIHEAVQNALNGSLKSKIKGKIYNTPLMSAFRHKFLQAKKQTGEIGLEIECEGMNLFDAPISWWTCHQDGSLRTIKDHPPVEYVLQKPIHRDEVPKALGYLNKKLREAGSSIVESHRTSVHVHLNCQDLTLKQIYQIWCMYTIFEEILVDFSGPDRPGNLFCLSSKEAQYQVYVLESSIQSEQFAELFSDNLRYTSCNTASLGKFGSLEFRSMRGTVDSNLIQTWVDLLLMIRDQALKYKNPREIVQDFQDLNSEQFLRKIFSSRPDLLSIFTSRSDRHKVLWDGLRLMRDVAMAVEWEEPAEEEKKKGEPEEEVNKIIFVSSDDRYYIKMAIPGEEATGMGFLNGVIPAYGYYWVVNIHSGNITVPRLQENGVPQGESWMVGLHYKGLFGPSHEYYGQFSASPEDLLQHASL